MATSVPGSHFEISSVLPVNVQETATGTVPAAVPGDFNLEVWTGAPGSAPIRPATGYQGLAVLSNGGQDLTLIKGSVSIIDTGTGGDTIALPATDTVGVTANSDMLQISRGDLVSSSGNDDTITGLTGRDTVGVDGNSNTVDLGAVSGTDEAQIGLTGSSNTLADGANVFHDTIVGFDQAGGDRIQLTGSDTAAYALAHATRVNGGADTMIKLNDGSSILLKGITSINSGFFS